MAEREINGKLKSGSDDPIPVQQVGVLNRLHRGATRMKKVDSNQIGRIRKKHNIDLLRRMQSGESLKSIDNLSSWFPPRPVISKDKDAIRRLYQDLKTGDSEQSGVCSSSDELQPSAAEAAEAASDAGKKASRAHWLRSC